MNWMKLDDKRKKLCLKQNFLINILFNIIGYIAISLLTWMIVTALGFGGYTKSHKLVLWSWANIKNYFPAICLTLFYTVIFIMKIIDYPKLRKLIQNDEVYYCEYDEDYIKWLKYKGMREPVIRIELMKCLNNGSFSPVFCANYDIRKNHIKYYMYTNFLD